jgi:hypothetical protein
MDGAVMIRTALVLKFHLSQHHLGCGRGPIVD